MRLSILSHRKYLVCGSLPILLVVAAFGQDRRRTPTDDAWAIQGACEHIRFQATIGKTRYSVGESFSATVAVQNNSDQPIALRRDKVGSTLTYERWERGHWEEVGGGGLGRGVGSSGAKPIELSTPQAVKAALEDYVLLYPRESFVTTAPLDLSFLTDKEKPKGTLKGRYRLTFSYADDVPDLTPAYSSTCKLTSNRVTFDIK
ncbi:MAG TPA: hypothetical protein VOA41_09025 [Candidatus Dormibacteraeota bacterium]|nr:hypothetical protein [Candidatus Dormibacteraeota bacterium]